MGMAELGRGRDSQGQIRFPRQLHMPCLIALALNHVAFSDKASKACKTLVHIRMRKGLESLNVATAAALMLYQAGIADKSR